MKKCSKCQIEKEESLFFNRSDSKDGLTGQCKECKTKVNSKWISENLDKVRLYKVEHAKGRIEAKRIKNQEWKRNNPEKVVARRKIDSARNYAREKVRLEEGDLELRLYKRRIGVAHYHRHKDEISRELKLKRERNPIQFFIKSNRDRAVRKLIEGRFTKEEYIKVLKHQSFKCFYCETPLKKRQTHTDHFVPIFKGGKNYIDNVVISCQRCNCSKQEKDPVEYYDFAFNNGYMSEDRYNHLKTNYSTLENRIL